MTIFVNGKAAVQYLWRNSPLLVWTCVEWNGWMDVVASTGLDTSKSLFSPDVHGGIVGERCVWSLLQKGPGQKATFREECLHWCREIYDIKGIISYKTIISSGIQDLPSGMAVMMMLFLMKGAYSWSTLLITSTSGDWSVLKVIYSFAKLHCQYMLTSDSVFDVSSKRSVAVSLPTSWRECSR